MRHLRARKAYAVRLVLLKNIRHTLVDSGLLIERIVYSTLHVAGSHHLRCTLPYLGIRLTLLPELFKAFEFLRTILLILEGGLHDRLLILVICDVQLLRKLGEQPRRTLAFFLVRRSDAHELELAPLRRE